MQEKHVKGMIMGNMCKLGKPEGIIVDIMCSKGVQMVLWRAACAGEECRWYGRRQDVQERSVQSTAMGNMCRLGMPEGMAGDNMCRRGVQGVW